LAAPWIVQSPPEKLTPPLAAAVQLTEAALHQLTKAPATRFCTMPAEVRLQSAFFLKSAALTGGIVTFGTPANRKSAPAGAPVSVPEADTVPSTVGWPV